MAYICRLDVYGKKPKNITFFGQENTRDVVTNDKGWLKMLKICPYYKRRKLVNEMACNAFM